MSFLMTMRRAVLESQGDPSVLLKKGADTLAKNIDHLMSQDEIHPTATQAVEKALRELTLNWRAVKPAKMSKAVHTNAQAILDNAWRGAVLANEHAQGKKPVKTIRSALGTAAKHLDAFLELL